MTEIEKTLSEALTYARVPELPKKTEKGDNGWIKAIALVRKANNRTGYVIVNNDGIGNPMVSVDFGPAIVIKEIMEVYPYLMRVKESRPALLDDNDILVYLVRHGEDQDKVMALLSGTYKNGRKKPEERLLADRAKVQIMVDRYSVEDMGRASVPEQSVETGEDAGDAKSQKTGDDEEF